MNEEKLSMSTKTWWALGQSSGRQFITALVSTYILVFMTDTFGVPIGGFSYKCGTALSNAIIAAVMAITGYIPNAIGQEPEAVLIGINSVRFLVPLAATVLYIIFIQFYPEEKLQAAKEKEK